MVLKYIDYIKKYSVVILVYNLDILVAQKYLFLHFNKDELFFKKNNFLLVQKYSRIFN